ncbi:MAG TPA: tetratricopeptide repeat protein, partial [Ferruginibacter sp.]|nr:tetratricopeptide repeat protein [Ferruginibacter sp.]
MRSFLFLLFFSVCIAGRSQVKKIDSLYHKLALITDVKEKINTANLIASEIRNTNADSAIALAKRTLSTAEKENYRFGAGTAYLCLALAYGTKGSFEIMNDYTQKALAVAEKINNDSLKACSILAIGSYNYSKGNYDVAIERCLAALKIFEKKPDATGILKTKALMSQVYQIKNDLPKAESILHETLVLFPKINDFKVKINTLHTLANVYGMEGKYAEALRLDSIGLVICEKEEARFLSSAFYDNMANCYMYSDRYAEAKKYFLLCLQIDSSFDNKKQMSDTYLNLG